MGRNRASTRWPEQQATTRCKGSLRNHLPLEAPGIVDTAVITRKTLDCWVEISAGLRWWDDQQLLPDFLTSNREKYMYITKRYIASSEQVERETILPSENCLHHHAFCFLGSTVAHLTSTGESPICQSHMFSIPSPWRGCGQLVLAAANKKQLPGWKVETKTSVNWRN
jgi:hypothetical protein